MIGLDSNELKVLLGNVTILRGQGKFAEAINLLEPKLNDIDDDGKVVALLQLMYVANDAGLDEKALEFATQLAKLDSEIPSVKKVLKANGLA
jgi:tetratricopeptide (TPR) repeat protein